MTCWVARRLGRTCRRLTVGCAAVPPGACACSMHAVPAGSACQHARHRGSSMRSATVSNAAQLCQTSRESLLLHPGEEGGSYPGEAGTDTYRCLFCCCCLQSPAPIAQLARLTSWRCKSAQLMSQPRSFTNVWTAHTCGGRASFAQQQATAMQQTKLASSGAVWTFTTTSSGLYAASRAASFLPQTDPWQTARHDPARWTPLATAPAKCMCCKLLHVHGLIPVV
jgi:hypothetical protein